MNTKPKRHRESLLERIDVALAARIALLAEGVDLAHPQALEGDPDMFSSGFVSRWIAGILAAQGVEVSVDDAAGVLRGESSPLSPQSEEFLLVTGMNRVLGAIRDRAGEGLPPDGLFLTEQFSTLTAGISRFEGHALRQDTPWDAIPCIPYPEAADLPSLFKVFSANFSYGDSPALFESLHPVRRSFRAFWQLARLAPFPDLNLAMSLVAMNAYLLTHGYPLVSPGSADSELLRRVVAAEPPCEIRALERRLLSRAAG